MITLPHLVKDWPADWREAFEERAAIMEFDAGMFRADADRRAEESTRACHAAVTRGVAQARAGELS